MTKAAQHTTIISIVFIWLILYTDGIVVNTKPHVDYLNSSNVGDIGLTIQSWFVIFTAHTMPNIALLCCLAALIGGLCNDAEEKQWYVYFARGLFVYLILISGLLLFGSNPFESPSQNQYTRLAGLASLFSFSVGYSPDLFGQLAAKIEALTKQSK